MVRLTARWENEQEIVEFKWDTLNLMESDEEPMNDSFGLYRLIAAGTWNPTRAAIEALAMVIEGDAYATPEDKELLAVLQKRTARYSC